MKIVLLIFALITLSSCSNEDYASEVLKDLAGVSMPKDAKLIETIEDCCSFNGDGSFYYVYEFISKPSHKDCDYIGEHPHSLNQFTQFKKHLTNMPVCEFHQNIDDVYN